jgi:tetratricopeptide (TPR) repeat protein
VAIADAAGFEDIRAFAESCLAQVYTVVGDLRKSVAADQRALATFEARGDVLWACRTLWGLSSAANGLGRWGESLEFCRRALEYGQTANDLRLKVGGLLRTGWTHIRRGDPAAGVRCCEEALALNPIPFDAAMVKAAHACALVRSGDASAGTAELAEVLVWFEESHLQYIRTFLALWLAEGYLRQGERARARVVLEDVLGTSQELGYRYVEGVAHRLMGECLGPDDRVAAVTHLETAARMLDEIEAADDLAMSWVALAELRRCDGDSFGARQLLERALASFEALGTLGEPARVRIALAALGAQAGR